ncbi:M14 family zinc carboxypeptidase [Citricoccus sp. GCM10030269]|uniref:M14 family zinc carboxypeptidase n=1 Tax=Citricoccus sp. GCM10030269 TaxID=3273388 RepID=UPI00362129B3
MNRTVITSHSQSSHSSITKKQRHRRSWGVALASAALVASAMAGAPATATPAAITADRGQGEGLGTCTPVENAPTSGWTSYAEMQRELERLAQTSNGSLDVESIGTTHQGRDVMAARVGTGPRVIMVTGAIHGNERTGVEAQLKLLKTLSGNSPEAQRIRSEVTFVSIPMLNPDGVELNRRINDVSWADTVEQFPQLTEASPAWYYRAEDRPGFDLNRDFHPDLDYVPQPEDMPGTSTDAGFYLNPESRAVRDQYVALQEEFGEVDAMVDLHHMGPCNETTGGPRDGKQVTVAIDYPPLGVDDGAAYQEEYPLLDQDKSRRYALAAMNGLTDSYGAQSPLAGVVRYLHPDEREFAGQGRSAFALNGSATVLFEVRGQTQSFGQKQKGMLVKTVETGLMSIVESMADGSVDTLDGDDFFDYPDYGWDTASGD